MEATPRARLSPSAAMWASAFVLTALIVVQAGRWNGASAEMVSSVGAYTALTTDSGSDEALVVIDSRSEKLFVYKVLNQSSMEFYRVYELPRLFADARALALGSK